MTITKLITGLPDRQMEQTPFDAAMAQLMVDLPIWAGEVNATAALMNAAAAGGAYAIPYVFSTLTADADPGPGTLRLGSSTQNTSTVMRLDLTGADIADWTSVLDTFDDSTSLIKGHIRLVKVGDASKWLLFSVTALASPSGYRNLTVASVGGSAPSPFANTDPVMLFFSRTGDVGGTGTILRRTTTTASDTAPTPNITTTDAVFITALAGACTVGAPTGTPLDGQGLLYRFKDNGTARALAFNVAYRFSPNLPAPTTTLAGKTLYLGFIYSATSAKWDLVALLDNFT